MDSCWMNWLKLTGTTITLSCRYCPRKETNQQYSHDCQEFQSTIPEYGPIFNAGKHNRSTLKIGGVVD